MRQEQEETNKEIITCADCQAEIDQSTETSYQNANDDTICESCHDNHYFECYDCGDTIHSDDMYNGDDESYCESCFNDNFTACGSCETNENNDDIHYVNGEAVCDSCFQDNVYCCDNCGEYSWSDDSYYCENCESDYCQSCWDNHEHNSINNVMSPFNFLQGKVCKRLPFFDYVGVEIETFGSQVPQLDFINTHEDGSIEPDFDEAVEITTLPASGDKFVKNIQELTRELRKSGFGVNKSCGLHVHIDCRKIKEKPQKISNLLSTYYAFEDVLFSMLPRSRWQNRFCSPLFTDYMEKDFRNKKLENLNKKWYKTDYPSTHDRYDNTRYHAFNAHSIFYRGSLEVRMHSGTLDADKIINWVYVLLKMKQWALNNYDKKVIKKALAQSSNKAKYNLFLKTFKFNNNKTIKRYIEERIKKFNPLLLTNKQNYWTLKKEKRNIEITSRRLNEIQRILVDKFYKSLHNKLGHQKLTPEEEELVSLDEYDCKYRIENTILDKTDKRYISIKNRRNKLYLEQRKIDMEIEKYFGRGVDE